MDAPPITRFMTMDSLVRFCQMWAKTHGYAVSKAHSTAGKNVYIQCDRSGKYQAKGTKKSGRKTASTKIDCPFELMGSIPTSQKITNKFWMLKVREGKHNHDPSPGASSHAAHRRLLPEQVLEVGRLFKSNVKPAQILLQLRTSDDQTLATNKTVSNALQKNRKAALDGKTPVKALMCVLKESNWEWEVKVNASGAILNLFFAHPGSIHLARINHHVALLDSTYKTNRYKLPLLHDEENYLWAVNSGCKWVGFGSENLARTQPESGLRVDPITKQAARTRTRLEVRSCRVGSARVFWGRRLPEPDPEPDGSRVSPGSTRPIYILTVNQLKRFIWKPERIPKVFITDRESALRNALEQVFPDAQANLCTWHINKNIATNCKKYFPSIKPPAKSAKRAIKPVKNLKPLVDPWKKFMNLWKLVTYAKSPEVYVERFKTLKDHLATRPALLSYIEKNIIPVKELFVVAWACQYPHLRNLNTSRVESGHAYLKTFVTNSTGDLLSVFQALALAVNAQILAVHESIGKGTIKTLVDVPKSCIPLLGEISTFAIKELLKQFKRLKRTMFQNLDNGGGDTLCSSYSRNIGMQEYHHARRFSSAMESQIKEVIEIDLDQQIRNLTIALSHETSSELTKIFDHINRIVAGTHVTVPIKAPAVKQDTKGRPSDKQQVSAASSTKRDPSSFEIVEDKLKKEDSAKKRAAKGSGPPQKSKRVKKVEDVDVKDIPDLKRTEEDTDEEESSPSEPKEDLSSAYEPKEDLLNGIFTDLSDDEDLDRNKNEDRDEENNEETAANEKPSNNEDQSTTKLPKEGGSIEEFLNNVQDTYISQLPLHLQPYIEGIFNPKGDGNCGFHCVAKALGYNDDGWFRARREMIKEITENKASYEKQQGGEQEVTRIVEGLQVKTKKSKITLSKWLDKMAHGQVLANTYTRPVIFLSLIACNSFIPSRMGPQESPDTKPIYLVHVDGNHWVLATVQEIDGVMPIPPLILAAKSSSKSARAWAAFTKKGVALYKQGDEKKAP
ncbi:hypothetical protein MJO28_004415 [Puccinia striiformis f. sp. tritici]|uniref:Uncharacterized protein n=1 Tax=Puccinia striiformis f. sp. tritici TaxID=168172 RepID=A0ACC0EQ44_9BASI|nr:hypothetical protein MJO28_004415 [Puccinia striiformis f. sp. tritici]